MPHLLPVRVPAGLDGGLALFLALFAASEMPGGQGFSSAR
jgi:hypothetical protein